MSRVHAKIIVEFMASTPMVIKNAFFEHPEYFRHTNFLKLRTKSGIYTSYKLDRSVPYSGNNSMVISEDLMDEVIKDKRSKS